MNLVLSRGWSFLGGQGPFCLLAGDQSLCSAGHTRLVWTLHFWRPGHGPKWLPWYERRRCTGGLSRDAVQHFTAQAAALAASHATLFNLHRGGGNVPCPRSPLPPPPPPPSSPINFGTRLQSPISHQYKMVPELLPHCNAQAA